VHGGKVAPGGIAAKVFGDSRLEVDGKPEQLQQEQGSAGGRLAFAESRPQASRRKEKAEEAGGEQHAIGLVAREILGRSDERQKEKKTDGQHRARPAIQNQQERADHAEPTERGERMRTAAKPEQGWRIPEAHRSRHDLGYFLEVGARRQQAIRTQQPANLKYERIEGGKVDRAHSPQKQPA